MTITEHDAPIAQPAPERAEPRAKPAKSVAEFGADWGLGRHKIYELIATGQLRAVKIGKQTRILAADEAAFVASLPRLHLHAPQPDGGAQ